MSKIVCVLPCIRPSCRETFLSNWKSLFDRHRVQLITVWDSDDPTLELGGKEIGPISKVLPEDERELVPSFTDSCRNGGFLWAARNLDFDFLYSLDDDTSPVEGRDSIQEHLEVLGRRVSLSWMNTGHGDTPLFRGFPYRTRTEATVELSHSCWYRVPDFDAITQLYLGDSAKTHYEFFKGVIPRGILAPVCGMSVMWSRKAAPYVYYAQMGKGVGIHRFGDIWGFISTKRDFDSKNYAIYTGHSMVNHDRASNVLKNLQDESLGVALNEDWWVKGDSIHPYFTEYKRLREKYQSRMEELLGLQ